MRHICSVNIVSCSDDATQSGRADFIYHAEDVAFVPQQHLHLHLSTHPPLFHTRSVLGRRGRQRRHDARGRAALVDAYFGRFTPVVGPRMAIRAGAGGDPEKTSKTAFDQPSPLLLTPKGEAGAAGGVFTRALAKSGAGQDRTPRPSSRQPQG